MKIKIELTPEEVDMAIRNYIRQSGMAIPDDGVAVFVDIGGQLEAGATYDVEIE